MKNYAEADALLQGRNRLSRKLANNTYLERYDDKICVRLHSTNIVTFRRDGSITLDTGGWNTATTRDRMNTFSPFRVWTESGHAFAGIPPTGDHVINYWRDIQASAVAFGGRSVEYRDGKLIGKSVALAREEIRQERNERNRPRNRARYWQRKAREGKPYRGDVQSVFSEENVTVRAAKMQCYGIGKFFLDAKAKTIDERNGYQLLELPMGERQVARAVQMECPSTGEIYINPVPAHVHTVASAMDWIFDTKDYLGTVTQQT